MGRFEMSGLGLLSSGPGPNAMRQRHSLVGALQKFDGHEHQLVVADVLEIVHLELPSTVRLVPRLARHIGVFHGGAVVHVLATAAAVYARLEIVEDVAVEAYPFAGSQSDHPYTD